MEEVSVNRGVLIGVVAVAAASLLGVAFLLGRVSGSPVGAPPERGPAPAVRVVPAPVSVPAALEQAPPQPTPLAASIPDRAEPLPATAPAPPAPEQRTVPPAAAGAAETADVAVRTAVAAYLDAVDHIQPGKMGGDAEGVANEMAAALVRGDASGLDKMIRETEAARASLAALAPPVPCVTHHRESLGSLDDALEMLRSLKSAMESPDPAAQLAAVGARAGALRSRSEAVQREEQALRQRYVLTR